MCKDARLGWLVAAIAISWLSVIPGRAGAS